MRHSHVCCFFILFLTFTFAVGWSTKAEEVKGSEKTCTISLQYPSCDYTTCSEWCDFLYGGYGMCTTIKGDFMCLCTYHC
ncbi:hypothetical protein MRB53_011423 [Persea americana]|uniref:Uncharacterized protein n=1 Tax=Persea americana TaxID=3435 RepID=A0ACC2LUX9_PERAE|nr:hypothetical protein MRB53_011423 [Persea americana]